MAEGTANVAFFKELASVLGNVVKVITKDNKSYTGTLKGFDRNTLSVVLVDAVDEENTKYQKIFIYGSTIKYFTKEKEAFNLQGLAKELERMFPPGGVVYHEDGNVIAIMNKVYVTEDGVEGTGLLADRVRSVYEKYVAQNK